MKMRCWSVLNQYIKRCGYFNMAIEIMDSVLESYLFLTAETGLNTFVYNLQNHWLELLSSCKHESNLSIIINSMHELFRCLPQCMLGSTHPQQVPPGRYIPWAGTPTPRQYTPWAGTPPGHVPPRQVPPGQVHPPGRYPPGRYIPQAGTPPNWADTPLPHDIHRSGQYASYWTAFLLIWHVCMYYSGIKL